MLVAARIIRRSLYLLSAFLFIVPFYLLSMLVVLRGRMISAKNRHKAKLVWGPIPIINNKYWSTAMNACGWDSKTLMLGYYSIINKRNDFDEILAERYFGLPMPFKIILAYWESLFRFDVFFISFDGWLLGKTPYWWMESHLFRLAGKRVVVIPYGADAFVYRNIRSASLIHGLMMSYPASSRRQENIARRVAYWCRHADCVIPSLMGPDGFGRWDVLLPSGLHIDTNLWSPGSRESAADGFKDIVKIAHAPNHRGVKGTEFIIEAVKQLQREGLRVELVLIEKVQNDELRRLFREEIDILVEQLIITGYGLNGLEGMASGLPVISNLEDEIYTTVFRRWSFLGECPIVSASPETLLGQLRKLVTRPVLRKQLGHSGRQYAEKYHGYDSAQYLFTNVIKYVYGEIDSLINLYHPLLGEYPKRLPKVESPLVDNKIAE